MSAGGKRVTKTPRQRAEESVGLLERQHTRLMDRRAKAQAEVNATQIEIADVERRLKHARAHPDLQDPSTTNTTED